MEQTNDITNYPHKERNGEGILPKASRVNCPADYHVKKQKLNNRKGAVS